MLLFFLFFFRRQLIDEPNNNINTRRKRYTTITKSMFIQSQVIFQLSQFSRQHRPHHQCRSIDAPYRSPKLTSSASPISILSPRWNQSIVRQTERRTKTTMYWMCECTDSNNADTDTNTKLTSIPKTTSTATLTSNSSQKDNNLSYLQTLAAAHGQELRDESFGPFVRLSLYSTNGEQEQEQEHEEDDNDNDNNTDNDDNEMQYHEKQKRRKKTRQKKMATISGALLPGRRLHIESYRSFKLFNDDNGNKTTDTTKSKNNNDSNAYGGGALQTVTPAMFIFISALAFAADVANAVDVYGLAIDDNPQQHKRLLKYLLRFGGKKVRRVDGESLRSIPDRLFYGGVGTIIKGDVVIMLRRGIRMIERTYR